jgi:dihydroxy-acid dehydratase
MEDLFAAGGLGAVLRELKDLLDLDCLAVSGETLGQRLAGEPGYVDRQVIRPFAEPYLPYGGLVALFGSLAPKGAILKRSAADPRLFERDVAADDFLVLQNAGPTSPAAMPEAGYLPIPAKLARAGVKDMVRISDARMSGTAFGTVVLHVAPDAASGGPLGLVRSGDRIRLSVENRCLDLLVEADELGRRRAATPPPAPAPARGYARLYAQEVLQADQGCDFGFLRPAPAQKPVVGE